MPFIPSKAEDITKEWLQEILESNLTIDDFRIQPASSSGDNFASTVQRVIIKGTQQGQQITKQLAVKTVPLVPWQREMATRGRLFPAEEEFYSKILPDMIAVQKQETKLEPAVPRPVYAAATSSVGVIVMEDLLPQGYVMVKEKTNMDEAHCQLVIDEMAKIHALGINLKVSMGTDFWTRYKELFVNFWDLHTESYHHIFGLSLERADEVIDFGQKPQNILGSQKDVLFKKAYEGLEPEEPLATVCLGDCWSNNMMFKYCNSTGKPISVKLLDLQGMKYSPPLTDLTEFLCISTSPATRKKSLPKFLELYRTRLSKYLDVLGVNIIPSQLLECNRLWNQYYKKYIYLAILMTYLIQPGILLIAKPQMSKPNEGDMMENTVGDANPQPPTVSDANPHPPTVSDAKLQTPKPYTDDKVELMVSGVSTEFHCHKIETLVENSTLRNNFCGMLEELIQEGSICGLKFCL